MGKQEDEALEAARVELAEALIQMKQYLTAAWGAVVPVLESLANAFQFRYSEEPAPDPGNWILIGENGSGRLYFRMNRVPDGD